MCVCYGVGGYVGEWVWVGAMSQKSVHKPRHLKRKKGETDGGIELGPSLNPFTANNFV